MRSCGFLDLIYPHKKVCVQKEVCLRTKEIDGERQRAVISTVVPKGTERRNL